MRFAYPDVRFLLLAIPLLLVLFGWARRRRARALSALGNAALVARLSVRSAASWHVLRHGATLGAVLLLTLAAARPQSSLDWVNVEQKGIDLVILLDVSESMAAEDIKPSRLLRAKQDVRDLLSRLEGDRVALVVFAGVPAVQSPLTVDYGAIRLLLDVVEPGMLPRPGTALEVALDRAVSCFDPEDEGAARAVLLITDGESHEGDIERAIGKLEKERVRVYTLGIGRTEGEPIPVKDGSGKSAYKEDASGQVVMTRLDEETLRRIAVRTGGAYVPVASGTTGVEHVARLIGELEEKGFRSGLYKLYEDHFVAFLAPAVLLLLIELGMRNTRRRRRV